jgi:hypothetical protein
MKGNLDRASELVYEAVTEKCWHKFIELGIMKYMQGSYTNICNKCGEDDLHDNNASMVHINPPLATSLDAWREHIWPVMKSRYQLSHKHTLHLREKHGKLWGIRSTALDHLEAALRALNLYDTWREGE